MLVYLLFISINLFTIQQIFNSKFLNNIVMFECYYEINTLCVYFEIYLNLSKDQNCAYLKATFFSIINIILSVLVIFKTIILLMYIF